MARPPLPQRLQRLGAGGKASAPRRRLPLEHHRTALALGRPPVRGAAQRRRALRHRQGPCDAARVRRRALLPKPQREAAALERAGHDRGATRGALPVPGELTGARVVAGARGTQAPKRLRPCRGRGQGRQGPDRPRDRNRGGLAAAPDQAGVPLLAPGPLDPHLIEATAQSGLARRR
jgi:hypothetical protein